MGFKYLKPNTPGCIEWSVEDWHKISTEQLLVLSQLEIVHQLDRIAEALEGLNSLEDYRETVALYKE